MTSQWGNNEPVHPHACGEHRAGSGRRYIPAVHPHACGEHTRGNPGCRELRFIPTPVGNTVDCSEIPRLVPVHPHACGEHKRIELYFEACLTVHPHACGEHPKTLNSVTVSNGSSPRLWGTPPKSASQTKKAVHPHACGEHSEMEPLTGKGCGSSPRLWGTRRYSR